KTVRTFAHRDLGGKLLLRSVAISPLLSVRKMSRNLPRTLAFGMMIALVLIGEASPRVPGGNVKRFWISLAIAVAFLALPGIAHADAIYQVGGAFTCPMNSCLGGSYT